MDHSQTPALSNFGALAPTSDLEKSQSSKSKHNTPPFASTAVFADSASSNEKQRYVPVDEWDPSWDDARSWLIVVGCFIFSAVTVGWGYVLNPTFGHALQFIDSYLYRICIYEAL